MVWDLQCKVPQMDWKSKHFFSISSVNRHPDEYRSNRHLDRIKSSSRPNQAVISTELNRHLDRSGEIFTQKVIR